MNSTIQTTSIAPGETTPYCRSSRLASINPPAIIKIAATDFRNSAGSVRYNQFPIDKTKNAFVHSRYVTRQSVAFSVALRIKSFSRGCTQINADRSKCMKMNLFDLRSSASICG